MLTYARYAHFKKLDYFSTECIYSPNAYRGFAREFIKGTVYVCVCVCLYICIYKVLCIYIYI